MDQAEHNEMERQESPPAPEAKPKLPVSAHLLCGWPLLLVAIGGLIGGALGGLAYGVNVGIYQSKLPVPVKVVLNLVVGLAAIAVWFTIAVAIQLGRS